MGALSKTIESLRLTSLDVAYTAPQIWAVGTPTVFTIAGGPVWIKALFARCVQINTIAATFAVTICGIAMQNAAVAINGAANSLIVWPLGAAVTQVIIPALLAQPVPTLATEIIGQTGQMASVGAVVLTVAGGVGNPDGTIEFYLVYQRMHPNSNVRVGA